MLQTQNFTFKLENLMQNFLKWRYRVKAFLRELQI